MLKKVCGGKLIIAQRLTAAVLPIAAVFTPMITHAQEDNSVQSISSTDRANSVKFGGYLRGWVGVNLDNSPEISSATGQPIGGKGKLNMLRATASMNASGDAGIFRWYGSVRSDIEAMTDYQRDLQDSVRAGSPGGPGSDMMKELRNNEIRELYIDADVGDRVKLRIGKQQIVWGETDFFHPSDVIHGFDYRWRQFYEPESDELRKPLFLINGKVDVPELSGNLQIFIRPGLDRKKDIGNSYDLYGGRWMPQPFRGTDFVALLPYNYEHSKGNYKDTTGGFRWSGVNDSFNYSLSHVITFQGDPTIVPVNHPYDGTPTTGTLGNFIFPKISVTSASFSKEINAIDVVLNGEIAFQHGNLFNSTTEPSSPFFGALSGFGPVKQKDVVKTTLRIDKQLRLQEWLGTNQASFASIQLFDTYINNFNKSDQLVAFGGYPAALKEHDTILTAFIVLNYMNSKLNPMLAAGHNLSTGDSFMIPSITYQYGNNWRFIAEADLFFTKHEPSSPTLNSPNSYPLSDFLSNHDQVVLRATYQF